MNKKIQINPPRTEGDIAMDKLFIEAVRAAKKRAKVMGCPVAGYDSRKNKPYIDYPDKGRVYFEKESNKKTR